jgi:alkylation response protein AidB-like acyl-CoA dehydrogenase
MSETFRDELRRFLLEHAPPRMRTPPGDDLCWGGKKETYPEDVLRWRDVMAARGLTAPTWPRVYGGAELDKEEARILAEELAALSLRPPLIGFGLSMIGPLLLSEGTEEQKREHLPPIVRGEVRWCQGYSEPGAGSDLASLQTRAVRDGEDLVVSGQKVWTSFADKADWMFLLVRTSAEGKKQDGITFLLMDMDSPGVAVKPIRLISGSSPFCETFLTDVRVPVRNVVGRIDGGWPIARALLGHERTMLGDIYKQTDEAEKLVAAARRHAGAADDGRLTDPLLRDAIAGLELDQACFDQLYEHTRARQQAGHRPGHESSIFKLLGSELHQRRRSLYVRLAGPAATGWTGPGFAPEELGWTRDWLRSRGYTIEGGTSEIQLNIIARRVLGLPEK